MAIELPKFENTYGLFLSACGKLKDAETGAKEKDEGPAKVARYLGAEGGAIIRAWVTGKKGTYLHVDCALKRYFQKGRVPKVTGKKEEVLKIIESVRGKEIELNINAGFDVPVKDIPENGMIRSLSEEQKSIDMCLKLTGAELSISGAPINRIHWSIQDKGGKAVARIHIRGEMATIVEGTYLLECWEWINKLFLVFVMGGKIDKT